MAKPRTDKTIFTDTGEALEFVPDQDGKRNVIVTWKSSSVRPRGRPIEKDWQGVLRWLVAKVDKEELPQGPGAQAKVAGWILDWFSDRNLEAADSLIKDQVRLLYEEVEKADN